MRLIAQVTDQRCVCYILHEMSVHSEFVQVVRDRLEARKLSLRAAASAAGLPVRSVQGVVEGHVPSIERAAEICHALGLEFYIGPPRGEDGSSESSKADSPPPATDEPPLPDTTQLKKICEALGLQFYVSPIPDEGAFESVPAGSPPSDTPTTQAVREEAAALRAETQVMLREFRKEIREYLAASPRLLPIVSNDVEDVGALAVAAVEDGATDVPGARSVHMVEMEAAAGSGAYNLDEAWVKGPVWFRRDWIDSRGIDPTRAVIISVRSDSMEPTLPVGSKILVDRNRRRRRVGHIFVITTEDGLIVKRTGKDKEGGWLLVSDSVAADWPDVPWPDNAEVIGEVKWMAREFP